MRRWKLPDDAKLLWPLPVATAYRVTIVDLDRRIDLSGVL